MPLLHRMVICVSALLLVITSMPPTPSAAEPTTRRYVGHSARLTAEIPRDWTADPTATYDYAGADGFVADQPVTGQTIEEACASVAASALFAGDAAIVDTRWAGQAACRINGHGGGATISALVVPHPYPFVLFGDAYAYAALIADRGHLDAIVATLDFSPDRVSPVDYVTSVLDIVKACAYWGGGIDWALARRELLASIDGLPTVEMARGVLFDIVEKLRAASDNHSGVLLPDRRNALAESSGFGFLVGGRQVLAVFPDGPAYRSGARAGDIIEAVDGQPLTSTLNGLDPAMLAANAADRWGLSVQLTLRRPGLPEPIVITVEQGPYSRYLPPTGGRLADDIGYIEVPHFTTPGREAEYVTTADRGIATADWSPTCAWIVDLRLNQGDSYSPMITGVGPILGNGTFVGWRSAEGRQSWVIYQDGRILDDGREVSDYLAEHTVHQLQRPNPPVAVLTGPLTRSAGEIAALAFVGRPETRLFGEPTGGYTSANRSYPLFDGVVLTLAESAMTDRTGATHMMGVLPDAPVAIDWTSYGTDQDQVLAASRAWLSEQPACVNSTSTAPPS